MKRLNRIPLFFICITIPLFIISMPFRFILLLLGFWRCQVCRVLFWIDDYKERFEDGYERMTITCCVNCNALKEFEEEERIKEELERIPKGPFPVRISRPDTEKR